MTPDDIRQRWDSLDPAGRDAWVDQHVMRMPKFITQDNGPRFVGAHWAYGPDGEGPFYQGPSYSTDIAAAREVEDRIAELGKQAAYVIAINRAVTDPAVFPDVPGCGQRLSIKWHLLHASSEARCLAALIAVEAEK